MQCHLSATRTGNCCAGLFLTVLAAMDLLVLSSYLWSETLMRPIVLHLHSTLPERLWCQVFNMLLRAGNSFHAWPAFLCVSLALTCSPDHELMATVLAWLPPCVHPVLVDDDSLTLSHTEKYNKNPTWARTVGKIIISACPPLLWTLVSGDCRAALQFGNLQAVSQGAFIAPPDDSCFTVYLQCHAWDGDHGWASWRLGK